MAAIFAWIWSTIALPSFVAGVVIAWLFNRFFGTYLKYVGECLIRWVRHPHYLLRGYVVCPQCYGTGVGGPRDDSPLRAPCWVCLRQSELVGAPVGYVPLSFLRTGWNWRGWHSTQVSGYIRELRADGQIIYHKIYAQ